jgi:hypothetical protein
MKSVWLILAIFAKWVVGDAENWDFSRRID